MLVLPPYRETRVGSTEVAKTRTRAGADYVKKGLYILYLPAFTLNSTWRGASEIIREYKYSLDNKISFTKLTQPSNPRFVACIAWKPTSETIVRYKLWEEVGEILYVPLYNGQKIGSNFSIEIWNVKPTESPVLATDDGEPILIVEQEPQQLGTDDGDIIATDDGLIIETGGTVDGEESYIGVSGLIGTVEEITHSGTALFHTSLMYVPTAFCDSETREIGVADLCTDLTFDVDDFIPFDGDYYNVIGDCGVTELVKGTRFVADELKLQSSDLTWHRIFVAEFGGEKHLFIEQSDTTPGVNPDFTLQNFVDLLGYRIFMTLENGEHTLRFEENGVATFDYNVVYLSTGGLYYGLRFGPVNGVNHLLLSQTGLAI